jgi:hypothetical protein
MTQRIIVPVNLSEDDVSLYSIYDMKQVYGLPRPTDGTPLESIARNFCQGFGVEWYENNHWLVQIFAYRVATIGEMNEHDRNKQTSERGGYKYICVRTPVIPKELKMLSDGFTDYLTRNLIVIGQKHHSSRYYFKALEEATYATFKEAYKEADAIAHRLDRRLELLIEKDILSTLRWSESNYPGLELTPEIQNQ